MDREQWRGLIGRASGQVVATTRARTFIKAWGSASRPVLVVGDDGVEYVVKGRQNGRMIFNDRLVALLGGTIGAPVAEPAFVDLPADLIGMQPELQHLAPGTTHATLWIRDCTDREGIQHVAVAENRPRFAELAVLYGWVGAGDHQFIYSTTSPYLVHSVDHGHFFPGGPNWSAASLSGAVPPSPDGPIQSACGLSAAELGTAAQSLSRATDDRIADAISGTPREWGSVSLDEQITLAQFLSDRREKLLETL